MVMSILNQVANLTDHLSAPSRSVRRARHTTIHAVKERATTQEEALP